MLGLVDCLKVKTKNMFHVLERELKHHYPIDKIIKENKFLYAEGEMPVMLVAHIDIVHKHVPDEIFWDKKQNVLWSPTGLGADDRAGVWSILQLMKHKPHILFCDEEEVGGKGAHEAARLLFPNVNLIIELDRRGSNDAVFYNCYNDKFADFICEFGFKESYGSFSDISILCPAWGIAGVNLSIGYYDQHTDTERLYLNETMETINKVANILKTETQFFEYAEDKRWLKTVKKGSYSYQHDFGDDDLWSFTCKVCKELKDISEESEYDFHVCSDCSIDKTCDFCGDFVENTALVECAYGKGNCCPDCLRDICKDMDLDEELFKSFVLLDGEKKC